MKQAVRADRWAAAASQTVLLLGCAALAKGDNADAEANCKPGWDLFSEEAATPANRIVGCYKGFVNRLTWDDASNVCKKEGGTLAAARSAAEQTELVRVANGVSTNMLFWISANSRTGIWKWGEPYNKKVDFISQSTGYALIQSIPGGGGSDDTVWKDMALVNGFRGAYVWKALPALPTNSTEDRHGFVCRKNACALDQDVKNGLCSPEAYSPSDDKERSNAWIAIVFFLGIVVLVGGSWTLLWYFANGHAVIIRGYLNCCKVQSVRVEPFELSTAKLNRRKTIADLLVQHPLVMDDRGIPSMEAGFGAGGKTAEQSSQRSGYSDVSGASDQPGDLPGSPLGIVRTSLPALMNQDQDQEAPWAGKRMVGMASSQVRAPAASNAHRLSMGHVAIPDPSVVRASLAKASKPSLPKPSLPRPSMPKPSGTGGRAPVLPKPAGPKFGDPGPRFRGPSAAPQGFNAPR